jgi:threonine dehydrogenase-like Zn-dependent dehydrogenase
MCLQIEEGRLHPEIVITHELPLAQGPHGFKIFNEKKDG